MINSGSFTSLTRLPGHTITCRSNIALADTPQQPQSQTIAEYNKYKNDVFLIMLSFLFSSKSF